MTIYIDIVMSILETISMMSKSGYSDRELLEYIDKHYDEIECELNGEEYKEPKKRDRYFYRYTNAWLIDFCHKAIKP